MGRDIVYLPTRYDQGSVVAVASPVLEAHDGTQQLLKPVKSRRLTLQIDKRGPAGPSVSKGNTLELFY